ncbi:hypothetical protein CVT25_002403 [Psilocybe cyanescens]|uniref:Uncharacterized protein n=1 Tax=Psilocybe cyanescens TaxID=93625 RepID=A0A409WKA1_PSICY|nr:hypothetical protein CVT25_002403 [Psilocybe cyanescens]
MSITSTELHRTRPLRSSPLAGPSVVSLGDQQPARPVSAHSPLGSKSKSFQTLSRPSSLYTTPSTYAPPPSWQSPHRRRPSTAPGPARPHSEHDSFNDDDGLGPNLHVRYSSSLLSVSETRPSSISLDPDGPLKNPRPILKHRTSFHSSPSSLSSSASSTEDVRFSAADKGKGKIDASSPRLSNSHGYTAQTAQTDESWYTFSPYATTPKFSRLGLASAGVVMPVSAKELARSKSSASRTKGQSAGAPSQGLSRTTSSASSSMRGRQSSTITDEHGLLTSNRAKQQAHARPQPQSLQQQRPQAPAPTSGSASGSPSATSWLNVPPPARTRIGKGDFKVTARGAIAPSSSTPADASASSSRSSTSTSVSTRRTSTTSVSNSVASSSTSLRSSTSYQQLPQIKKEEKVKKEKRKSLSLSLGLRSWRSLRVASPSTAALGTAGRDRDEATMIPLPSPPLAAHFPDSPTSPSFTTATVVSAPSIPQAESVPTSSITNQTPLPLPTRISTSTSPLPSNLISTPARNSISSSTAVPAPSTTLDAAPVHKLKKRKSASAILARVKSWRWGAGAGGRGGRGAGAGGVDGPNVDGAGVAAAVDGADKAEEINVDAVIPVPALVVGGEDVDPRKAEEVEAEAEAEAQSKAEVEVEVSGVEVVVESQQQHPSEDDVNAEANILIARQPNLVSAKEATDSSPTPTSTSPSSPSLSPATIFTPMPTQLDTLIPSPNLHVSSYNVPGYIQSELQLQAQTDTRPSPAVLALVEAMAPVLASSLHSSSTSLNADVAVDEDFIPSSNFDSTLTLVSEQHEHKQDIDCGKVLKNEDRMEALDQIPVQELDKAPQNLVAVIESDVHIIVADKDESVPISVSELPTDSVDSVPAVVRTSTSSIPHSTLTIPASAASTSSEPASAAPTSTTTTPLLPSTSASATPAPASAQNMSTLRDRGRSQSRTRSLSTTRARSRSVRRIWNSLVCGAADAEQMAIEAWAEVQAGQNAAGDLGTTAGADMGRGRGVARDVKGRDSVRDRGGEKGVEMEMEMDKGDAVVVVAVVPAGLDVPSTMVKVATA